MLLRISRTLFVVACAFVAVIAAATLNPEAPIIQGQDALGTIKEALGEYKKGNYEEAIKKFDAALAADPSDEDARRLRDEIGAALAREFIENNFRDPGLSGRFARFGKWVMTGLGDNPYKNRNYDPDNIAKFVDEYMADADTTRNLLRAASIRDSFGDYAVPYLQANYMHSDNQDYRFRARLLLATIGTQAVTAIVQCFYSTDMHDRQTAALALGDIRDPRALPILAKHFQDKNEDEQVREACRSAITLIRADNPETSIKVNDAKDLFYLQAEGTYRNNAAGRYYNNRLVGTTYEGQLPVAMYGFDRAYTVWKWIPANAEADEMALVSQEVPLWAYADILAEESCMQAIDLGIAQSSNKSWIEDAEALLSCVHMHMYVEGRGRYYNGSDAEREFIVQKLGENGFVPNQHGFGLGSMGGSPVLYRALERSLGDGYQGVSVALCDAIAEQGDTSVIGTKASEPLKRALSDPDRNVQYAAARTMIRLGAKAKLGASQQTIEVLAGRNLQETQARNVLVIFEDEKLRQQYISDLDGLHHGVTAARTLEEGADLAMQGPAWDAIIIDGNLAVAPVFIFELPDLGGEDNRQRSEPIFHLLKKDVRTADIPVLIATESADMDTRRDTLSDLGVDESRFIPHMGESGGDDSGDEPDKTINVVLRDILESIWSENVEHAKSKTNQSVIKMANAIATLDPGSTKYSVERLLQALAGGVQLPGRSSEARVAICEAISVMVAGKKVGAAWVRANVIPNLLDILNSDEAVNRPSVKGAASAALGDCYMSSKGAWDEDGFNALLAQLRLEYDLSVIEDEAAHAAMILEVEAARNAAGVAIGKAPTTPAQRKAARDAQNVNPHAPHPGSRSGE